jgi:hypothetical protein
LRAAGSFAPRFARLENATTGFFNGQLAEIALRALLQTLSAEDGARGKLCRLNCLFRRRLADDYDMSRPGSGCCLHRGQLMPRKQSFVPWLAIAFCCLLFNLTGCCARRGYLLHGDWSLELNRVPWRGDHCGEGDRGGCSPGCGAGDFGEGAALDVAGPPPRSRFHPVPIRDVFTPAEVESVPAPAAAGNSGVMPDASGGSARAGRPVPARYARKAKSSPCPGGGICQTAATEAVVEPAPATPVKTVSGPRQQPPMPKARLSTAWHAATRS